LASSRSIGQKTVLAVRIFDANNVGNSFSQQELSDSVFGNNGADPVSLRSQYSDCSHGQLTFVPTTDLNGQSISILNGVTTVRLTAEGGTTVSDGDVTMRNAVSSELESQFGMPPYLLADHVMYCLPPNTMSGGTNAIAYAFINSWLSIYNDEWCTYVSAQMHEIGHNINMDHAGEGPSEYGDTSGMERTLLSILYYMYICFFGSILLASSLLLTFASICSTLCSSLF
jgi:hypothetical protein